MFASSGEITPPWGVPSVVRRRPFAGSQGDNNRSRAGKSSFSNSAPVSTRSPDIYAGWQITVGSWRFAWAAGFSAPPDARASSINLFAVTPTLDIGIPTRYAPVCMQFFDHFDNLLLRRGGAPAAASRLWPDARRILSG
jgi:hypothetical protein